MTNRLRHLEDRGLVSRRRDPEDARSVRVRLTAAGTRRVDAALKALVEREDALLAGLSSTQREALADLLALVVTPFDA